MGCAASLIYDALSGLVHDGLRFTMGFAASLMYVALSGLVYDERTLTMGFAASLIYDALSGLVRDGLRHNFRSAPAKKKSNLD